MNKATLGAIATNTILLFSSISAQADGFLTLKDEKKSVSIKTSSIVQIDVTADSVRLTTNISIISMKPKELDRNLNLFGSALGYGKSEILNDVIRHNIRFMSLPDEAHRKELERRKNFFDQHEKDISPALKTAEKSQKLGVSESIALAVAYDYMVALIYQNELSVVDLESILLVGAK